LKHFFEKENGHKYIGIMVHATLEELTTPRYELLIKNNFDQRDFIEELCMHDLIMTILHRILRTLMEVKQMAEHINSVDVEQVKEFCREEITDLDQRGIHKLSFESEHKNIDLLKTLADAFLRERVSVKFYSNERFQMRDVTYQGNYSSFTYMHAFVNRIKKLIDREDFSFYILIDNGDETKNTMQMCIDHLISQRKHRDVCIKVAVKKGVHWDTGSIQWPHDYSQIDIDELYSTRHTVYYNRIKDIADKRLKLADVDVAIEEFLPESPTERVLLEKIKDELKEKCETEYEEKYGRKIAEERPSKSDYISNRVNKYAQAELFRRLKKTGKSYAGFDNIVNLSSGIIRQFLDICSYMFDEEVAYKGANVVQISLRSQNGVIKKYADDFIDELEKKYKALEKEKNFEEAKYYKGLYNLIEALGKYYKKRLLNPKLREPRNFTFTLKDPDTDQDIDRILETGVIENYFQRYWYSSKIGIAKYRGYAFNRRLCPRYGIDHTSFRGRIALTTADLKVAIEEAKIPKTIHIIEEDKYLTLDTFSGDS